MDENFYINLIYKKLSGELSPDDQKQLQVWLDQSADNRHTAKSVEKAWTASDVLNADVEVDLDTEFGDLEKLMEEQKPVPQKETIVKPINEKSKPRRNWLSIAAGLLLLASVAFLLRNYFGNATNPNQPLEWTTINTGEEGYTLTLPDNSKVYLNRNSKIDYPNKFAGDQRLIKLKGEAFFEVEHNPKTPFVVQTKNELITVLGTSFNVNAISEILTRVYVLTGKVQVEQNNNMPKIVLTQGEMGFSKSTGNKAGNGLKNMGKKSQNALAWHTKKLEFSNTLATEVLRNVQMVYGVSFDFKKADIKKCTFTATFENQKLETVLETIGTVLGVEIKKGSDKKYILTGGNC